MRSKLFPLLLILFAVGVAYAVYWRSLAEKAEDAAEATDRMLAAQGIESDVDWTDIAGFPYRLQLSSDAASLAGELWPVDWNLRLRRLDIFAQPWTPDHLVALLSGVEIRAGRWSLKADETRASWLRSGDRLRVDADYGPARLQTGGGVGADIRIGRLQMRLRHRPDETATENGLHPGAPWQVALSARDIASEAVGDDLASGDIGHLTAELSIYGPLKAPFDRTAIAAWRDAGGIVEIDTFSLSGGGLTITGSGSLTLDEAFRPIGALTLTSAEPRRLIALLERIGAISPDAAPLARQAVRAAVAAAGEGEEVDLPFTLQDGQFQLAGLELNSVTSFDEM